jgi:hypothetical protein
MEHQHECELFLEIAQLGEFYTNRSLDVERLQDMSGQY